MDSGELNGIAEICRTVSAYEAGIRLGLDPRRDGRCACPVHNGHDRNCKLWKDDRGYYCYVCHAGGDTIQLVKTVLNCTFVEAIKWLSDEFNLGVDIYTGTNRETLQRAKKQAKIRKELQAKIRMTERQVFDAYLDACDVMNRIEQTVERTAPKKDDEKWNKAFCTALKLRTEAVECLKEAEDLMMDWGMYENRFNRC